MENRFGLKDLVMAVLLLAILATMWVGIYGYNRQNETLRSIERNLDRNQEQIGELGGDLRRMRVETEQDNPMMLAALWLLVEHLVEPQDQTQDPPQDEPETTPALDPDADDQPHNAASMRHRLQQLLNERASNAEQDPLPRDRQALLDALRENFEEASQQDLNAARRELLFGEDGLSSRVDQQTNGREHVLASLAQSIEHRPGSYDEVIPGYRRIRQAREHPGHATGDWVVEAFGANLPKLTPIVSTDIYQRYVENQVLEPLALRDPDTLELEPVLARDWQVQDNTEQWWDFVNQHRGQPITEERIREEPEFDALETDAERAEYIEHRKEQGLTIANILKKDDVPYAATFTFNLRRDVIFSDGRPMTADDVVFSFELIMDPEIEAPRLRSYLRRFDRVEKIDDYTVRFYAIEPYYQSLLQAAGLLVLPEHVYSQYSAAEINRHPSLLMGTGPYRLRDLESWTPGQDVELVRNDRYWADYPTFDRIVFRPIAQDTSRMVAFRNGEIDLFQPTPEQHHEMVQREEMHERAEGYSYETPTSGYTYIGWNQKDGDGEDTPFADRRVRRAMTKLIPRQRIADEVWYGYASVANGPFSPLTGQASPDIEPLERDPDRAIELLAEAGYTRDADGVLRDADGEPFTFTLTYPAQNETHEDTVYFVRDALARAGITVNLRSQDWAVFRDLINNRDFQAITLGWSGSVESDPYQIFHSDQIAGRGDNFISYRNEKLDELIEQARMALDEADRMPLWHQVHEILHEDQPYTFMMRRPGMRWVDNRFRNVQVLNLGINDRKEWFVPPNEQRWSD